MGPWPISPLGIRKVTEDMQDDLSEKERKAAMKRGEKLNFEAVVKKILEER